MRKVFMPILWSIAMLPMMAYAVDITYRDLNDEELNLSDYKGKWVVVNYWATYCPPCLEEIPDLIMFHDNHKEKDAVVVGVNMEEIDRGALVEFTEENLIGYPVIPMVKDMKLVGSVPGLPTTFLIDPEGRIAARRVGAVTAKGIEKFINNN